MSSTIPSEEKMPRALWEFNLFNHVINKYSEATQLNQLQEELAELIVSVNHYRRGRITWEKVCEEMADVLIMIAQFESINNNNEIIKKKREEKIIRLAERSK